MLPGKGSWRETAKPGLSSASRSPSVVEPLVGQGRGTAVRYVVVGRARDYRCGAGRGVLRVHWPMVWTAAGVLLTLNVGCGAR